jgi:hypothetical protein
MVFLLVFFAKAAAEADRLADATALARRVLSSPAVQRMFAKARAKTTGLNGTNCEHNGWIFEQGRQIVAEEPKPCEGRVCRECPVRIPPHRPGIRIVGRYHTHPRPGGGPDEADRRANRALCVRIGHDIVGFVITDDAVHAYLHDEDLNP